MKTRYKLKFIMQEGMGKDFWHDHNREFNPFADNGEMWDFAIKVANDPRNKMFYKAIQGWYGNKFLWGIDL